MDDQANPCAFVPLSKYSWEIVPLLSGRRGACNGITLAWNPTVICLFVALYAVAVWTALAVCIQAVVTFKRYSTIYFWSIILTAWATITHTITMDLMLFTTFGNMLVLDSVFFPIADTLSSLGFLLVLWSRLHLIMDSPRALKALLVIILIIAIPLRIIIILSAIGPNHKPRWGIQPWQVLRRVEMVVPGLEMSLAALYIYLFIKRFRWEQLGSKKSLRRVTWFLVAGELFVIAGDATVVSVWFSGFVLLRWAIAPFLYALKLQVEFLVLNSLTRMGKESVELRTISVIDRDEESGAGMEIPGGTALVDDEATNPMENKNELERQDVENFLKPEQGLVAISSPDERAASRAASLSTVSSLERTERKYLGRISKENQYG